MSLPCRATLRRRIFRGWDAVPAGLVAVGAHNRRNYKHGHYCKAGKSITYQSWSSMNDRCLDPNHKWHHRYGGRGITVCDRWRRGQPRAFENFLDDMGARPNKRLSLDRYPDPNGNYEKSNCRWATGSEQQYNKDRT